MDRIDAIASFKCDTIVVGAGSSGCALAARLSESAGRRVLLLEAGTDFRSAALPAIARSLNPNENVFNPALIWPNLTARGTTEQQEQPFLRGRGVGGSSLMNMIVAIRPPPDDFAKWQREGCASWGWRDVLPYFKRLETDLVYGETAIHGGSGPTPVQRIPREAWGPADRILSEAARELGVPWRDDANAETGGGVAPYPMNVRDGVRITAGDAYLEPARDRRNLHIVGDALVDRVLFDGRRAIGVRVHIDGEWRELHSDEIVLCAGAAHSPAILLRSGVGPAGHLRALAIPVNADLPVGRNALDHPLVFVDFALAPHVAAHPPEGRVTCACVQLTSGRKPAGANDLLMMAWNRAQLDTTGRRGAIGIVLMESFSRGEIELRSRDPFVDPAIDQRMLSDASDLERMVWGLEWVRSLARQLSMRERASDVGLLRFDLTTGMPIRTPLADINGANVRRHLLQTAISVGHLSGTCRMGAPDDSRTVVDEDCRVLGVDGLRVVDCSVMPEIVRVNTHLTATMLGEAIADRMARL